jgi:anaerobic selenocysteine-containing dehydrogenase
LLDSLGLRSTGYGPGLAYAQYTPPVSEPPQDSDLLEEWEFFYGLMKRLGYPVVIRPTGIAPSDPGIPLSAKPTTDELLEIVTAGSRVPLETVKQYPGGACFPGGLPTVGPARPDDRGHLDIGNPEMMALLARELNGPRVEVGAGEYPFRLVCRRHNHTYNTSWNVERTNRGIPYNPAFMNPLDIARLGLADGQVVILRSANGSIPGVVGSDPDVRPGLVSMAFGYGPSSHESVKSQGSSPNRLIRDDQLFDPYIGQPRMSNIPIAVETPDF